MWQLRKFWGNIPPTDPRILELTQEQIELEFMNIHLDKLEKDKSAEQFEDEEYDQYEQETDKLDANSSWKYEKPSEAHPLVEQHTEQKLPKLDSINKEDWVRVEIDEDEEDDF